MTSKSVSVYEFNFLNTAQKIKISINSFKRQSCHHIETSQLVCRANQLTGFYMMATLAFNELRISSVNMTKSTGKCGFGHIKNIKELS